MTRTITGKGALRIADAVIEVEVTLPADPVSLTAMLPFAWALTDEIVRLGTERALQNAEVVSCKAGCGACCNQLVPISGTEAVQISKLVENLPEPRRTRIREKFVQTLEKFGRTELLSRLRLAHDLDAEGRRRLGLDYFFEGVACPFLENGSCSIYSERPLVCREYLVSSPAANCSAPSAESVKCLEIKGALSQQFRDVSSAPDPSKWIPLTLALEWTANNPPPEVVHTGPEWMELLLGRSLK